MITPIIDINQVYQYIKTEDTTDSDLNKIINICIEDTIKIAEPKFVYKYFDLQVKNPQTFDHEQVYDRLKIKDSKIEFLGNNIKAHLKDCHGIIMLAVTIGIHIDKKIRSLEVENILHALIYDSCSSIAVDNVKSQIQSTIQKNFATKGLYTTDSFSPGYGDFPLEFQKHIVNLLDTNKTIGVSLSNSYLLFPRKTITSIIGVSNVNTKGKLATCSDCIIFDKCEKRLRGNICGME